MLKVDEAVYDTQAWKDEVMFGIGYRLLFHIS